MRLSPLFQRDASRGALRGSAKLPYTDLLAYRFRLPLRPFRRAGHQAH